MNAHGDVVYRAHFSVAGTELSAVVKNHQLVARQGGVIDGKTLAIQQPGQFWRRLTPRINDNGQVLYQAITLENFDDKKYSLFLDETLLFEPGDVVGDYVLEDIASDILDINSKGDVLFRAEVSNPNDGSILDALVLNGEVVIKNGDVYGGKVLTDIRTRSVALGDNGDFLFAAIYIDQLDQSDRLGLFYGGRLVASEGDIFGNDVITNRLLGFDPFSLNSNGDIVFNAPLSKPGDTNRRGLFVARRILPVGDFDNDTDVDGNDFLSWQRGDSPNPLSQSDLDAWQVNYGTAVPFAASSSSVPEPSAMLLGMIAILSSVAARRR